MKKIFMSIVGLAAAGTASLHANELLTTGADKAWSVEGTLRGFYDDNYTTTFKKHGSLGFEVSPQISLDMPLEQTEIDARYTYGLYYYQQREKNGQNPIDQSHQFDLWVDHAFNPRLDLTASDSFRVAQEPALLAGTGAAATTERLEGNNIANTANLGLRTDWTREFSTTLKYANNYYHYSQSAYSVPLDRVEQSINAEGEWHWMPTTDLLAGYILSLANYTGDGIVGTNAITGLPEHSDARNYVSHTIYAGLSHEFSEYLKGSAKAGVTYSDYYNESQSSVFPYAKLSLDYTYGPGSYAEVGFLQTQNATETTVPDGSGHLTTSQETSVVYGSINHAITAKLKGSLVGHYQYSIYNGGLYNNQSASWYSVGLQATYAFNQHLSANAGYNFDYYTSDVPGLEYTRNVIFLGVSASF
ncbi:MAG: outer membrane beta-barrel protein [Verrucomicrobiota bacterium]|nr:outer membrane beta-barrel protein [Verrucomicrobiota bacterium]